MSASSPHPDPTDLDLTGQTLGDYQLLRRLGYGGMAHVYLAQQISLKRNVALKILRPELARDEAYVKRFEREAQAAAALVQANIVQIYEVGQAEGYHFIAQEYVPGRNLRQYLGRHGAVEPVMAINVLRQCALALQKAAELGVVHRDIKPENIMLSTKGEVKITDFGLARINNNRSQQALTQIGVTMGTPLYMSPEQVGGLTIDHRSDIYSLGITAYHMLAGHPPFDGENALAIAVQHVNESAPPLDQIRPDVPIELIRVIEKMMAKQPGQRPQSARELIRELRKVKLDADDDWELIIEKLTATEIGMGAPSTSWSQSQLAATRQLQQIMLGHRRSWWRSPLWAAGLVLLALLGWGGGYWAASRSAPEALLNVKDIDQERIPRKANVVEQYEAARWVPLNQQESYYKAVYEYFPASEAPEAERNRTRLYNRNAKARLAEWYLMQQKWAPAEAIYQEFIGYEELAEQFRVTGWAGLAIVYAALPVEDFPGGPEEKSAKTMEAIGQVNSREALLNPFLRGRFEEVKRSFELEPLGPGVLLGPTTLG